MTQQQNKSLTLVLGGARSGKSTYAQQLASRFQRVLFIATAQASDPEMRAKIGRHKADRAQNHLAWDLAEEPVHLAKHLSATTYDAILIDCLTLFAGNILAYDLARRKLLTAELLHTLAERSCAVIIVSNEVGSGVVPEFLSGRLYRDLLGELNQQVAGIATKVVLMVAGLPLTLKSAGAA